ncbi:hypothetical protein B0T25DRAFT_597315 [Lasiosphaeria hispida]|uniref:Uncharacterized protein n=1 Tax=Lasiosphaeria hispida TaxID=260671 RepID=A0AAJ0HVT4_9PEZI|nr:hypothetical protein B0T25DRAFT_597315 [Lasiosphaeria hispida]
MMVISPLSKAFFLVISRGGHSAAATTEVRWVATKAVLLGGSGPRKISIFGRENAGRSLQLWRSVRLQSRLEQWQSRFIRDAGPNGPEIIIAEKSADQAPERSGVVSQDLNRLLQATGQVEGVPLGQILLQRAQLHHAVLRQNTIDHHVVQKSSLLGSRRTKRQMTASRALMAQKSSFPGSRRTKRQKDEPDDSITVLDGGGIFG